MEEVRLSLKRTTVKYTLEKEDGSELVCLLKEMTGPDRDAYLTRLAQRMQWKDGKPEGMKNVSGIQSYLIELCLYDETGTKKVNPKVIATFPAQVQDHLFKKAQEISVVEDEGEEDDEGNVSEVKSDSGSD